MNKKITVLMSMYKNSVSNELEACFDSLLIQTYLASEYVLVIDGPVSNDLHDCVNGIQSKLGDSLKVVQLDQNVGLGNALKEGMKHCTNEIIARMDTDDICDPTRFEKQIACFEKDPELSIVGSNIAEFIDEPSNIVSERIVPQSHAEICEYLKKRCPFNHMAVMFKKSEVERAGGYLDWHYDEDSYLWARMYLAKCKFANLPENLVFARINTDTFMRRGGYSYYKSEKALFHFMYKNKIISFVEYLIAIFIRFVVQVLMPNKVRQWFFSHFARNK